MGLSCTVSEINGDFTRKSQKIFHSLCPAEGVPLELGTGSRGQRTRMMGLLERQRSLMITSDVWIQSTNVTDGQTDGHWATAKTAIMHSIAR